MAIEEIAINNFRNLIHVRLHPSSSTNLIIGNNGSGKTSLLETIYYLGTARSFRTPHSKFLINHDAKEFTVYSKIANDGSEIGVGIARDKNHIKIKIANQVVNSASRLAELLPVQLINPDIHKLMEEGPRYRRRFIEWGVFHVKPTYLGLWQQCTHILRQRNAALRLAASSKELNYWDQALEEVSEKITLLRLDYLNQLQPVFEQLSGEIQGLAKITIGLKQGWPEQSALIDALHETRASDQKKGFTQYGPHRADLKIMAGSLRAKDVVSRGQQKLIAALLKLAQLKCLLNTKPNNQPLLLVDDLPAELDKEFQELLFKEIVSIPVQSFITGTSLSSLPINRYASHYRVFHVKHGQVEVNEL
ncbi:DNA replication/repair protein RecF [Kaarinaea lacus]